MTDHSIPLSMAAVVLRGHGDFDQMTYVGDWPVPKIEGNEVLVRVRACGLNNTDINTRTAWYSKDVSEETTGRAYANIDTTGATWGGSNLTFPRIQGADVSGFVVAARSAEMEGLVGKRVLIEPWIRDWADPENDGKIRYLGSEIDGGFADYVKVDARQVHPIDSDLSDAELATFATSYVTAENMLDRAAVEQDDVVLVSGASGGVGSAVVQLAKRRGATVVALCSGSKRDAVAELGADVVLFSHFSDLAAELKRTLGSTEVSVVADVVGGELWPQLIEVLCRRGRYTCSGSIAGPMVPFDLRTFYLRDLTFTGATIVPPGKFEKLVGYIERREIKPVLATSYPLRELAMAQERFLQKKHVGNIVVTMA